MSMRAYLRRIGPGFFMMLAMIPVGSLVAQESRVPQGSRDLSFSSAGPAGPTEVARTLYQFNRDGVLNSKPQALEEYRTPFFALIHRNRWPPEFAVQPMEALLCAVNSHICCPRPGLRMGSRAVAGDFDCRDLLGRSSSTARLRLDALWRLCQGTAAVCDFRWAIRQGGRTETLLPNVCAKGQLRGPTVLCVPAITVTDYVSMQRFQLGSDRKVRKRARAILGCPLRARSAREDFEDCEAQVSERILDALNGGDYRYAWRASGALALPVRAYNVSLVARSNEVVRRVTESAQKVARVNPAERGMFIFDRQKLQLGFRPQADSGSSPGTDVLTASSDPDHEPVSLNLLKLMHWEPADVAPVSSDRLPTIVVLEGHSYQKDHLELKDVSIVDASTLALEKIHTNTCPAKLDGSYETAEDIQAAPHAFGHGAWVTSVIAALQNHRATVGILPASGIADDRVTLLRVEDFEKFKGPFQKFFALCASAGSAIVIVNVSATSSTPSNQVALRNALIGGEGGAPNYSFVLGVVAAGDSDHFASLRGMALQPGCGVYPGCVTREMKNLISVVALAADGTQLSQSSLFGPAFEVAAIGDTEVIGPQWNARAEGGTGTSFAVPYVSALASFVYARYMSHPNAGRHLPPHAIKARIVSTVNFRPELNGKVAFGVVDFHSALDLEHDHVTVAHHPCDVAAENKEDLGAKVDLTAHLTMDSGVDESGTDLTTQKLQMRQILRLSRTCQADSRAPPEFTVVVALPEPGARSQLRKVAIYRHVSFKESHLPIALGSGPVPVEQLGDFTACMRAEPLDPAYSCLEPQGS